MRLTAQAVGKLELPGGKSEIIVFDEDFRGFGIRLRAGGSSSWVYQYTIGTRQRRMTIGSAKVISAADARATAATLHARVRLGQDPAATKAEDKARADETFAACLKPYLARRRDAVAPSTYSDEERYLVKGFAALHGIRIDRIDRRDVAAQLARITLAGPIAANRARAAVSGFLGWCLREGFVETNAAALTNRNAEQSRARVLTDDELRSIWQALPTSDFGDIIKLLLLTGQRRDEIADLRWAEVDLGQNAAITLPPSRTKNRRAHLVPLSPQARAILEAKRSNGRELIFGTGKGGRGFNGWSPPKRALDARVRIEAWTIHDLRRSAATGLGKLGTQPHIIEAVINHVSGHKAGVAGIYNRSTYEPEKRKALDLWGAHVAAVVS